MVTAIIIFFVLLFLAGFVFGYVAHALASKVEEVQRNSD